MGRLKRLQHIGIKVSDIENSMAFYRDVLGLKVSERHEPGEAPGYPGLCLMRCERDHHHVNLIYSPDWAGRESRGDSGGDDNLDIGVHHFAFEVDTRQDFDEMLEELNGKGVEIVMGPVKHSTTAPDGDGSWGENRSFYFLDPDRNRIEIFCEMHKFDE